MSAVQEGAEGAFQTLLGSVQSHLEDRLKSPFAGAFIIAWLACNWKPVMILMFSTRLVEDRIKEVSVRFFSDSGNVIWMPLIYAAVGVVAYYVFSTAFVVLYELYGMLRRWVERKFDNYRWVPPSQYVEMKRESKASLAELTDMASDNLTKIQDLQGKLADADIKIGNMKVDAEESSATAKILMAEKANFEVESKNLRELLDRSNSENAALSTNYDNNINRLTDELNRSKSGYDHIRLAIDKAKQEFDYRVLEYTRQSGLIRGRRFDSVPQLRLYLLTLAQDDSTSVEAERLLTPLFEMRAALFDELADIYP